MVRVTGINKATGQEFDVTVKVEDDRFSTLLNAVRTKFKGNFVADPDNWEACEVPF